MKSFKISIAIINLLIFIFMYGCTKSPQIHISIEADSEFPIISLINPLGENVNIEPISSEQGSVGFEKDGTIHWIKGKPIKMTKEVGKIVHLWKIDSLSNGGYRKPHLFHYRKDH